MPIHSSLRAIACSAVIFASVARADDIDPRFDAYLKLPETREAVSKAIRDEIADWDPDCTDVKLADESSLTYLSAIKFADGADKPAAGSWIESISVEACGSKHLHNVESIAHDGGIETASRLNGTTIANVELQNDAIPSVLLAAGTKSGDEECTDKVVVDTEFKSFVGDPIANAKDGPNSRQWREDWTVLACKKTYIMPVVFTPDDTGTGIAVESSDAKTKN